MTVQRPFADPDLGDDLVNFRPETPLLVEGGEQGIQDLGVALLRRPIAKAAGSFGAHRCDSIHGQIIEYEVIL